MFFNEFVKRISNHTTFNRSAGRVTSPVLLAIPRTFPSVVGQNVLP